MMIAEKGDVLAFYDLTNDPEEGVNLVGKTEVESEMLCLKKRVQQCLNETVN